MKLKFFGRGSGFADDHTSAYFTTQNKEMVIIDCPAVTFFKLKKLDLSEYKKFYILVTHTHDDHVGLLGLWVQYAYFTLKKPVTIVAPSEAVAKDISTLLTIGGNDPSWYELILTEDLKENWFISCVLTKHSPQLEGKCFGYNLFIDDKYVVYTGDTSTLEPFMSNLIIMPGAELYVDTSVYYGMIHLKLEDALKDFIFLSKIGIKVYLMHLDDVEAAEKIIADYPEIKIVSVE